MLAALRRRQIVEIVERQGLARVADLADQFGVSGATINRDLETLSSEGLIDKVYGGAVVAQPDEATVSSEPGRRSDTDGLTVAMVVPTDRFYYRTIIRGAQRAFDAAGVRYTVVAAGYDRGTDAAFAEVDGAIVTLNLDGSLPGPGLSDLPAVVIERNTPGDQLGHHWSVATDISRGIRAAVRHLTDLGHTRIALTTLNRTSIAQQMAEAWRAQLTESGCPEMPWIANVHPGTAETGTQSVDAALDDLQAAKATAVVCFNDVTASVMAHRAEDRGQHVPHDLSIIGYGNEVSQGLSQPMSVIAPPKLEIGRLAANLLVERLRDPSLPPRHVLVDPQLLVRSSTAAPGTTPQPADR